MAKELSYQERKRVISELPHDTYWVLGVVSIYGYPLANYSIEKALDKAGFRPESQRTVTHTFVRNQLRWLQENGYIDYEYKDPYTKREWRDVAARHFFLHAGKTLNRIISQLRREERLDRPVYSFRMQEAELQRQFKKLRLLLFEKSYYDYSHLAEQLNSNFTFDEKQKQQTLKATLSNFLPLDPDFILALPAPFHGEACHYIFHHPHLWEGATAEDFNKLLKALLQETPRREDYFEMHYATNLAMQGISREKLTEALPFLDRTHHWYGLQAMQALLQGNTESAGDHFKNLSPKARQALHNDFWGAMFLVWQCRHQNMKGLEVLRQMNHKVESSFLPGIFNALRVFFHFLLEDEDIAIEGLQQCARTSTHPMELLFVLWVAYWIGAELDMQMADELHTVFPLWEQAELKWMCGEMANALALVFPDHPKRREWEVLARYYQDEMGFQYLIQLLPRQSAWERILNSLDALSNGASDNHYPPGSTRLVWFVDFEKRELQPKEQKRSKRNSWSAGRKVTINDLYEGKVDNLTEEDQRVLDAVTSAYDNRSNPMFYYGPDDLRLDFDHALYQLTNHPFVFLEGKNEIPVELVRSKPELLITEEGDQLRVNFRPVTKSGTYVTEKETPTRYRIYKLNDEERKVAKLIGRGALMPEEARPQMERITQQLQGRIQVQSPKTMLEEGLESVPGDPMPCLHLLPFGEGFKLEFYVKPLKEEAHYFKPGEGLAMRILSTKEGRVACERRLDKERALAAEVIEACPTLAEQPAQSYEWQIEDTRACLQILLELHPLREAGRIKMEFPKGEKVKLLGISNTDQLSVRIQEESNWFAVDGSLKLDEEEILQFQQLLDHVREDDSPFVELGEGTFIALTETFRERLRELDGLLQMRGQQYELNPLAGLRIDELAGELAELEADQSWAKSMQRIQQAQRIRPRVPNTFQADLRAYQKEGFRWMMRLAEWGVGGCLADDMGLGKTVQALAMLSARKEEGPGLVIAPASVTRNWVRETARFAPDLTPKLLGNSKEVDLIDEVGPGDLLIISYGLLPFVEEALTRKSFGSLVLDEAQAIKNAATKRSKIAMELRADFRLATTGTPIENHLGELWNLFRFLNPGLLGSQKRFNEKFTNPISKGDEPRREQLRRLIQPFILRRHKRDVLTELPAKTEIILSVSLTESEHSFYEAIRRSALEAVEAADGASKRFAILAQLTKLRQAACHPRLVMPDSRVPSSKLDLVGETILELLDSGHKALVFSQFVKHLRIVEQWVKAQGIPYQYLDGQTPGKKREEAVQAFQNGEGQLFLISLKAGGTGLNLTEADYVLHLDPWWNPAVEDQASDRAHRMGQQRPVTVYRFVSEDTIEEKIVQLHQNKRELADQLLSGTDVSAKLSVDDMLSLLKGEA
ncbi:DEAD/DEAH box helicase [Phaeodactylibacter xiamenensis]|uniref:DEAD/DEAH box helicase n=1 Tax=Phaeodactylibacter xiamenensis TaxID=1524460 RepID=UPI003BA89CED